MTKTIYDYFVNSPETTLVDAISAYDVSFNVADGTKLPAAPNIHTIGTGEDAETVHYTSLVGNLVSGVTRGYDKTGTYGAAKNWGAGEVVARRICNYDLEAMAENITGTGDVFGPASDTSGNLAVFTGTDGKHIADSGLKIPTLESGKYLKNNGSALSWDTPAGGSGSGGRNVIINGDCRVNQRGTAYTLVKDAYSWDSSDLTGPDRHEGMATGTAVSAGTFGQSTSSLAGSSGYGFHFSGVTLTGTGVIYQRGRIEANDAARFKNQTASFSCKVYQDTGGAVNFTVYIRKANSADNFAAVTAIGNSGAVSVPNATDTSLNYEAISMGDCSCGIEYEIKGEVGAITTKNVYISEVQLEIGSAATAFEFRHYNVELALCQRYCFVFPHGASGLASFHPYNQRYSTDAILCNIILPVIMRTNPTFFSSSPAWAATTPSGNECAAFDIPVDSFVTATGAVTLALNGSQSNAIQVKFAAATSFSGTAGDVCNVALGSSAVSGVSAEL